jgi:glycosyltransferase involved in cell wall biosynthesis
MYLDARFAFFGELHLNILYYGEPDIARGGGVSSVAYYLPKALRKKVDITYLRGISSNNDFPKMYFKVGSQFISAKFDIIHFNSDPTWKNGSSLLIRFAKVGRARTVLNIHGIPQLERRAEQWPDSVSFRNWLSTLNYCKLADRVVVNSEFMRDNVIAWYRLNSDKVVVIPNGVDLKMFSSSNDRVFLEGDPSILYVGHLSGLKGVDILIHAVAKLRFEFPKIKLHLVGNGNAARFAALSKDEGIEKSVIFHSWTKPSMIPSYYKSADICVFPSRHEGFGIVILEAMASGVPVIASDIPSFREIISNGFDGRLFKSQDIDALTKEVAALYRDPNLGKELAHNAFEKVTKYSWDRIAEKYLSLYKYLCEDFKA